MPKTLPAVGTKVRYIRPDWYDGGTINVGETGTVVLVDTEPGETQPTINVQLDKSHKVLEDNIFAFYPQCGPQEPNPNGEVDTVAQFWYHCEVIK